MSLRAMQEWVLAQVSHEHENLSYNFSSSLRPCTQRLTDPLVLSVVGFRSVVFLVSVFCCVVSVGFPLLKHATWILTLKCSSAQVRNGNRTSCCSIS